MNLLMISGFGAKSIALKKQGAFYNTLEEFHKYWDRIDIIAPGSRWWFSRGQKIILFGNAHIHISPLPLWLHPFWIRRKGAELCKQREYKIATVQSHPPFYNEIGARWLGRVSGVPYVLEVHHVPGYPRAADLKEQFYRWLMRHCFARFAREAVAIRVVNRIQAAEFLKNAKVPEDKIKYIPSAYIDLELFRQINVPKKYDVIAIARLTKNKGLILLLDAIARIKKKRQDIKAVIVGEGPERKRLEREVRLLSLDGNIKPGTLAQNSAAAVDFVGWVDPEFEVQLLNQSRILVVTSYNEGGPRVALEAMACRVPVITTRVGIMLDLIEDSSKAKAGRGNGLFVDWNSKDIAEKIITLLADKNMQEQFSKAGLEIVKQFEKKKNIRNYAKELKELVEK